MELRTDDAGRVAGNVLVSEVRVLDRSSVLGLAALAAALAFLAHFPALHGGFVYDDQLTVVENPSLRSPGHFLALLLYARFRPVVNVSYALNYAIGGLAPFGYHLVNLLLHALNAALLFFVARPLFARGQTPERAAVLGFAAASIFAVHPALTQAVAYVSGRSELLCGTFVLLGLLAFLRAVDGGGLRWWLLGFLAQLLAVASKEPGVMLAPVVLLDAWLWPGEQGTRRRRANRVLLPLAAALAVAAIARAVSFLGHENHSGADFSHLAIEAVAFWKYVQLFFAPFGLALIHFYPPVVSLSEPRVLMSAAALTAFITLSWVARHRAPVVSWGCAAFGLCLLPAAVVPLLEPMSEHRAYVADGFGLIAVIQGAALGVRALERIGRPMRPAIQLALLTIVVFALAGLSIRQDRLWADPVLLWERAAEVSPEAWAAQYAMGDALRAAGHCRHAILAYRRATVLKPREVRAYNNLAICLGQLGRYREAFVTLEEALRIEPNYPPSWANLAVLAVSMHYPQHAAAFLRRGIQFAPDAGMLRERLAAIEAGLGAHPSSDPPWPPDGW
jgi:hypothetical protein